MRKIYCEHCKKELNALPLKQAIKNKEWWKYEIRDFGLGNLLIIIAIVLLFSGLYFEFGPKIKNPCDWCMVSVDDPSSRVDESKTCTEWLKEKYNVRNDIYFNLSLEVENGSIADMHS